MKDDRTTCPKRSFYLVIKDFEQELEIIHFVWAMLIIGYKAWFWCVASASSSSAN